MVNDVSPLGGPLSQACPAPTEVVETLFASIESSLPAEDRQDLRETLEDACASGGIEAYVRLLRSWDVYARLRADGNLADALDYRPWGRTSEADRIMDEAHRDFTEGRAYPMG